MCVHVCVALCVLLCIGMKRGYGGSKTMEGQGKKAIKAEHMGGKERREDFDAVFILAL